MIIFKQPLLQLVTSSILLGLGAVFVVFIDLSPTIIAFYRLAIGAVLFFIILLIRQYRIASTLPAIGFALLSGAFLGADLSLWNTSIILVGPGIATILNSLQVFFMAGFGIVFLHDKPTGKLWLSLMITFIGIVLLCSNELNNNRYGIRGIGVGVLSGLMFAASMLCLREAVKYQTHSIVNTMFYASIGGVLATGIYAVAAELSFVTHELQSWVMVIIYGSVFHVLAWFLMAKAMPKLALAITGLVMCLEPVTVFFIDLSLLGKQFIIWQYLGAILTITAIYLGSQSKTRRNP